MNDKTGEKVISFGIAAAATLLAIGLLYFLPFQTKISQTINDGGQIPFGPITKEHPLEKCLPNGLNLGLNAYHDGKVELLLATYNRVNTSHYTFEFYDFNNGRKDLINKTYFEAASLADNSYKSFDFHSVNGKVPSPCFTLKSSDATDENAITIWMNGKSEPYIKVTATTDLPSQIKRIGDENIFILHGSAVYLLFFSYFVSLIYFALYLLTNRDGSKEIPKPAYHKKTHGR